VTSNASAISESVDQAMWVPYQRACWSSNVSAISEGVWVKQCDCHIRERVGQAM
jgi:hypothetical protein